VIVVRDSSASLAGNSFREKKFFSFFFISNPEETEKSQYFVLKNPGTFGFELLLV